MQYWRREPRIGGLWSAVGQEAANFKIFLKRSLNQTLFPPFLHAAWMAGTLSRCYYFSKQLKKWFTILCFTACFHVSCHTQGDVRYPHWSKDGRVDPLIPDIHKMDYLEPLRNLLVPFFSNLELPTVLLPFLRRDQVLSRVEPKFSHV